MMRCTKTALIAIVALLLLTVFTVAPAFAQKRGHDRPDDLNGFLGGKMIIAGSWNGSNSYSGRLLGNDETIRASQHSAFGVFGGYRIGDNFTVGLMIENAQNDRLNIQSGLNQITLKETTIKAIGAVNTQWFKMSNQPTPYSWWQGTIGYAFDISGRTISWFDGSAPRLNPNEIGNAHEDNFFIGIRSGFGSQKVGIAFLELRYTRVIPRISVDDPNMEIKNTDLNHLSFSIGINM